MVFNATFNNISVICYLLIVLCNKYKYIGILCLTLVEKKPKYTLVR